MTRCQWTLKLSYYFPLVFISLSYTISFYVCNQFWLHVILLFLFSKLSINIVRLTQAHRTILQDAHDCGYCANAHTEILVFIFPPSVFLSPDWRIFFTAQGEAEEEFSLREERQMRCDSFVAGNEKLSCRQFFSNINQVPSQN